MCVSGKTVAYFEKTNLQVNCSSEFPMGTGVRAEGRHQRDADKRIDDEPTFCRKYNCQVEVLRLELFQL